MVDEHGPLLNLVPVRGRVPNSHAATEDGREKCASYSTGGRRPIEVWSRVELYQTIQEKIARRAWAFVAKCSPSMASRLKLDHTDSACALEQVVNHTR